MRKAGSQSIHWSPTYSIGSGTTTVEKDQTMPRPVSADAPLGKNDAPNDDDTLSYFAKLAEED